MKRILIVDDNQSVRDLVVKLISTRWNDACQITQTADWTEAVDIVETEPPFDMVITDFRMPRGREGLSVINAAKEKSHGTKVILMSGDLTNQDREEAMADRIFDKPFSPLVLISAIAALLPDIGLVPA